MPGRHERFRWSVLSQDETDPREVKYNKENANELNSYAALAIVDKPRYTTVISRLRDWEKGAVYRVVSPNRSGHGFTATSLEWSSPEAHIVGKPSSDEQLSVINFGKLIGSLEGGKIVSIPFAESLTGAIPVVDTEFPDEIFYYIPAQIEPLTMNRQYFENKPSFIILKGGEMPSYVFWQRKADYPPSYTAAQLVEHYRTTRSGAPTPEPRSSPVAGPSKEPRSAALAVNTNKSTEVVRERQAQPEWEVFDPRLEKNPIEFLDYYNICLQGRMGVRSKLMLREADIDRVNYISPCLAHSHRQPAKETEATATDVDAMEVDVETVPTTSSANLPEVSASQPSKTATPKPWKQPEPIAADDPAWKNFFARIDRDKTVRNSRISPKPVFTSEFCNAPGTKSDPKKAILTRELYEKLYRRAVLAHRELENRSKCCFACGLQWTLCPTIRYEHYKQHREEYKLHMKHCFQPLLLVEDPLRVEDLDAAKAPLNKGIPEINWFRDLEQITLNIENELLEREHVCRICSAHIDFAHGSPADHYRKHAEERKQLRAVDAIVNSPHTPPQRVTSNQFGESPDARTFSGFGNKRSPEYWKGSDRRSEERNEEAAKQLALELAKSLETSAQQLRETGTIENPIPISSVISSRALSANSTPQQLRAPGTTQSRAIQLSSDSSSSAASTDASSDVFGDGPIHSDVIGKTTAQLAFAPLFKLPVVPQDIPESLPKVPTREQVNLDFLSGHDANTVVPVAPERMSSLRRFMDKERHNARQNRELNPVPFEETEDADAHLDADPISEYIEVEDSDDDLYASPAPAPVSSSVCEQADSDHAEIIQAIRTNSGELLALNDDSEGAEGVLEVIDLEDFEEVPEEFAVETAEDVDANGNVDANEDVDVSEEVPPEFGRMPNDDAEDFDDSTSEDFDHTPDDYPIGTAEAFAASEMVKFTTNQSELTPAQRKKAREWVENMIEEHGSHEEKELVAKRRRESNMTQSPSAPSQTEKHDIAPRQAEKHDIAPRQAEKLDTAKVLALATGNNELRKMNMNLADAFAAIAHVDQLIKISNGTYGSWGESVVSSEQEILDKLVHFVYRMKEKFAVQKRVKKAPIKRVGTGLENAYLNTDDLLNGIRLELYDMWRVIIKAKEAFQDMEAGDRGRNSRLEIMDRIIELTRRALVDTYRHGYRDDEPFLLRPAISVRHDGLDLEFEDLEIDDILTRAYKWGCGINNMRILATEAWDQAVGLVKAVRASSSGEIPEATRLNIVSEVKRYVRSEIRAEKRWRLKEGHQLKEQESQIPPCISSAKWSTEAQASEAPRTPCSPWSPVAPVNRPSSTDSVGSSQGSNKPKRPSALPTPRKRKASDTSFHPGPPTPFNPDEVSPRIPKMPRRSNDPLYRPGSVLQDPTTPPVTPKFSKRSSNQKDADRAAKKIEKKLKKKQANKAEKKVKNVSFDAQSSISSASSKTSSPQVVITKKTSKKSPTPSPSTASKSSKSSKNSIKNVAAKSGVKKTPTKAKKSDNAALAARPKRQAAIEAEKSFGKTRVIE